MAYPDARFIAGISDKLGADTAAFLAALEELPATSILLNPAKVPAVALPEGKPVPWCPNGRILDARPAFGHDPLFHAGAYYVQESSSMFLSEVLRQCVDGRNAVCALDMCAAPGGKSVLMLSGLPEGSLLVSNEVHPARWETLQYNLDKWGANNVISTRMDPSRMPWPEQFDLILVDAPCSGEGMFRKDMEAREQWSPDLVALCAARQKRILHDAVRLLRPGGLLVYSTCTFNDAENMDQVVWLARQYQLEPVPLVLQAEWNIDGVQSRDHWGYQFFPHKVPGEGFFCSILRKPGNTQDGTRPAPKKDRNRKSNKYPFLAGWIDTAYLTDNTYFRESAHAGIECVHTAIDPRFTGELKRVRFGTSAGYHKAGMFTPSHALALSVFLSKEVPSIALSEEAALGFLRKEKPEHHKDPPAWYVARYHGLGLGWLKQTASGFKNYLPTHLRIRN